MNENRKKRLLTLLKQYKRQLTQTIQPKKGDWIKLNPNKLKVHVQNDPLGKHWLKIINKLLKDSGKNALYVKDVDRGQVYVSSGGSSYVFGSATVPNYLIDKIL